MTSGQGFHSPTKCCISVRSFIKKFSGLNSLCKFLTPYDIFKTIVLYQGEPLRKFQLHSGVYSPKDGWLRRSSEGIWRSAHYRVWLFPQCDEPSSSGPFSEMGKDYKSFEIYLLKWNQLPFQNPLFVLFSDDIEKATRYILSVQPAKVVVASGFNATRGFNIQRGTLNDNG